MDFTHLHVHSDMSPDGLGTVDNLVKSAKQKGFKSLAITDHGSLGNHVSFWSACQDYEIKPIFGLEAYLQWAGKRHHITMNTRTKEGFDTLIDLSNEAHKNFISGYPLMTVEMMQKFNKDIWLFTGCPASPIHVGELSDGANFVGSMADIFENRVMVEVMMVLTEDLTSRPLEIAKRLNLPIVVTNDVHFTDQRLKFAHNVLTECRKGYTYDSAELYMRTGSEMLKHGTRFFDEKNVKLWMQNAYDFSESVEAWDMKSQPKLPTAEGLTENFYNVLETALQDDLIRYSMYDKEQRLKRFQYELKTLQDMNFIDYFTILYDIVSYAKNKKIVIGPGRGSAAGSYILYLLGITSIDPIEHKLYFERFLNPARKEYPDVDLDIESDFRQDVLDYAYSKWGAIAISTYSRYSHKSLVNDLARYFKVPHDISKEAGDGEETKAFARMCELDPLIEISYDAMIGQIRHAGKHAGGAIITDKKIPIEKRGDHLVAAWTEGLDSKDLSKIGVVKYDILGVSALSQLHQMRDITGCVAPKPKDFDDPVFEVFQKGDIAGVFQWGSDGIRKLTMDIVPKNIKDLTVINSLFRPGALDAGTAMKYPEYILHPRLIETRIDELLEETNGVLVFQEQVMSIFALVTGGSLVDADLSRRVIFKPKIGDPKWEKEVKKLNKMFLEKGKLNGFDEKTLNLLWSEIYTHSRYSFNRAHSAAYAHIAYEMAWFKMFHPLTFYTVMLQYDIDMQQLYLFELVGKGYNLLVPHINKSTNKYIIDDKAIRLPLSIVKFLSEDKVEKIVKERNENGVFKDLKDFRKRIPKRDCNARVCKLLYNLGSFEGISGKVSDLFEVDLGNEKTIAENQVEGLGFVLPNKKIANYIKQFEFEENIVAGFIQDWHDKKNKKGKFYRVYSMLPNGMFWSDDEETMKKVKKGDLLKVVKNAWGKEVKKQRVTFSE